MDKLIQALGPAFAAGFAIQQLLEIFISPLVDLMNTRFGFLKDRKKNG